MKRSTIEVLWVFAVIVIVTAITFGLLFYLLSLAPHP